MSDGNETSIISQITGLSQGESIVFGVMAILLIIMIVFCVILLRRKDKESKQEQEISKLAIFSDKHQTEIPEYIGKPSYSQQVNQIIADTPDTIDFRKVLDRDIQYKTLRKTVIESDVKKMQAEYTQLKIDLEKLENLKRGLA